MGATTWKLKNARDQQGENEQQGRKTVNRNTR